jgi:hypothetical protein
LPAAWGQTNLSQLTVPWQTTNAGKQLLLAFHDLCNI